MHIGLKVLIAVTIALTIFINEAYGGCSCGGASGGASGGTDYCSCQTRVPRPRPLFQADSGLSGLSSQSSQSSQSAQSSHAAQYTAIGDTCSCGGLVVQPAQPPKPAYSSINLEPTQQMGCQEKRMRAPQSYQGPLVHPDSVYGNKPQHKPLIADAVSLSLAYQLARSLRRPVPEDKIQYGFRVQPINGEVTKVRANIPEERLSAFNRAIVELRAASAQSNNEDDDDEDESNQQEARSPGYLTYGDIGYCPEKYPTRTFSASMPASASNGMSDQCSDSGTAADSSCGYQPGKIDAQAQVQRNDHYGIEECLEGNQHHHK